MKRPTIKDLEAQIAALRELREGDRQMLDSKRAEAAYHETECKRVLSDLAVLKRDKEWLQHLCAEQSSAIAGYMRSR